MSDTTVHTLYPDVEIDERGRFFDGQFLTAQDFVDEQRYHSDRLRRALDLLTVGGVATGLTLTATGPWLVRLAPGTALDERGRLLVVPGVREAIPVPHDLDDGAADVSLFYAELETRVQGGNADEPGTRGATRLREVPALEFHRVGVAPEHAGVRIARITVAADGVVTVDPALDLRKNVGLRLPAAPGDGPTLRSGGAARPNQLQATGDLALTGKLAVGTVDPEATLDVRGLARVDDLSVRAHSFRVDGDETQFYPIVFSDLDAGAGASVLELSRANAQADAANAGSLIARLRWHAADGHGSELLACEIVQTRRFIAAARPLAGERLLAVWLRGNRTYAWRGSQQTALIDGRAVAKNHGGEALAPRPDVDPAFDRDRVHLGARYDQIELRGPVAVTGNLAAAGDLAYTGVQSRLNTAEQTSATVRASDLNFGHSSRRGQPGRALVDAGTALTINLAGDWPTTRLGGATTEVLGDLGGQANLTLTGNAALGGTLTVSSDASFKKTLTLAGDLISGGALTVTGDAALKKSLHVATTLTVTGDASLKSLAVATTLTVVSATNLRGPLTVSNDLFVSSNDPNIVVTRTKGQATGGSRIFLELRQDDANPVGVPEVGVGLRFQHTNRFSHRIEADSSGLSIRHGNPDDRTLRALSAGNMFSNDLAVTTGASERLRIIRGTVTASGTIAAGKGFSVSKFNSNWQITFDVPFADEPTVVATQQHPDHNLLNASGDTRDNAVILGVKPDAAYIRTGDSAGDPKFRRFHFIAIGTY